MTRNSITITSARFHHYKALRYFVLPLQHMNMLVGPNNAGKSTIIGAFRVLAVALLRARSRKPEWLPVIGATGYPVAEEAIPISTENIHTNYDDVQSTVAFELSNGRMMTLIFPPAGGCYLVPDATGKRILGPADFKREFPVGVGFVPVLGPLDDDEELVQEDTVRRGLATHRASRHFRSYWYYNSHEFDLFRIQVQATWPGMDVLPPEISPGGGKLAMFCTEDRLARELYWAGSGFQVWCQLLTYLVRSRDTSLLVIDEPEIYLHPNLQRQLVTILREAGPDIVLATHSSDIVTDAEPQDLLLVDKNRQSARRMTSRGAISLALELLGSAHNAALTQIARTRRVIFAEGDEFRLVDRFARRLGIRNFGSSQELAIVPLGGFPTVERVKAICFGIRGTLGIDCIFGGVFDRDYKCDEEVSAIQELLQQDLALVHIHARKEIENYLLLPDCLDRAVSGVIAERTRRGGSPVVMSEASASVLLRITEELKGDIVSQYQSKRLEYLPRQGRDQSTVLKEAMAILDAKWANIETRIQIVPGKRVFALFAAHLQDVYGLTITPRQVIDVMRQNEIPEDLRRTIRDLDRFRVQDPSSPHLISGS